MAKAHRCKDMIHPAGAPLKNAGLEGVVSGPIDSLEGTLAERVTWLPHVILVGVVVALAGGAGSAQSPFIAAPGERAIRCDPTAKTPSPVMWSCILARFTDPLGHAGHWLSAVSYDPQTSTVVVLPDRSADGNRHPISRLQSYRLQQNGSLESAPVLQYTGYRELRRKNGTQWWEMEAIAPAPGGYFAATEGDELIEGQRSQIYWCPDGGTCAPGEIQVPEPYRSKFQKNTGVEGLSTTPDGSTLFVSFEGPLDGDGPPTRSRILAYSLSRKSDQPVEYIYPLDSPGSGTGPPGIADILALSNSTLLVLERSYAPNCGNTIRLFEVSLDKTTAQAVGLPLARSKPLEKTLVLDLLTERDAFRDSLQRKLDNFEGLAMGPMLPGQAQTLFLVSDDNWDRNSNQVGAVVAVRRDKFTRIRPSPPLVCPLRGAL